MTLVIVDQVGGYQIFIYILDTCNNKIIYAIMGITIYIEADEWVHISQ
jgi:hypothetical protein